MSSTLWLFVCLFVYEKVQEEMQCVFWGSSVAVQQGCPAGRKLVVLDPGWIMVAWPWATAPH